MKKKLLLTLVLVLLCTTAGWAQFAPEEGKMYALQETTTDLYLDISVTSGNIVLSSESCVIYFAAGTDNTAYWTMKNVNGSYLSVNGWNAVVSTTADEWIINEPETDIFTIARKSDNKYIGAGNSGETATEGSALYSDCNVPLKFKLVELTVDTDPYVLIKAPTTGNYLSLTLPTSTSTQVSFQATGTKFVLENSSDGTGYYIKQKDSDPAVYLSKSSSNNWDVTTSTTAYTWLISDADANGYVTISHVNGNLGHDGNQNVGTGVFANVGIGCNKWLIEEYNAGVVEYTFAIDNTTGEEVSATYNGAAIVAGGTIEIEGTVDTSLFDATDVEGYAWSVVVDSSAKTITIVYVEKYNGSYYLKTSTGTYLNLTPCSSTSTGATFQAAGTEFYIEPSGDNYYITQLNSNPVKYFTVSSSNAWDVTTSTTAYTWLISDADANGYVTITKASEASHRLGNDANQNIGTGVYANVGSGCNTWQLVKVGPLDYTFAINNPTDETVSATYNGNPITDGATVSIDGRVDTSLFSASEIEGYIWNVELDPDTKTITLVYEKKYSWSVAGLPAGATITYNNNAVIDGGVVGVDFDSQYLSVACPDGYTWAVTRDNENKTVTITFTRLQSEVNPKAVVDLINRIGGAGTSDKFQFELDPSLNYANEVFVISGDGNKVLIKGTTISAITTGIGWYLQNIARINIAWNSLNEKTVSGDAYADLSNIPLNVPEETHTSDAMYRYYLNTCAFGYSMTSWTWKRWQQEIDWMALHGINMPLQLVGMEEVWRKFLTMEENGERKYGYDDASAKAFVAGPAFIAWWAMNNLEGWGGTAPGTKSGFNNLAGAGGVQDDAWYARQKTLAKQICDRQRELGMQPVIPGWSGMVPTNFASKSGYATRSNGGKWAGDFVRPLLLNVSNANYGEIAADYYKCLHEVMGESQYYSMDPFHEGGGAGTMEDYEAMYAAMEAAKPGSQWVIQQWQWSPTQRLSLTAVPAGRLIVLDLFADGSPAFDSYNGFAPQDAVFSTIPNFGGRSGLMGRLTNLTDNYFKFKAKYASIKGIGAAPEAIEQTPVTYDLIFQLPWMNGVKPDVAEWVSNYAIARYGQDNEEIKEAWSLLRQGPLNYGADAIQGPVEDVWAAKPNLTANKASEWGKTMKDAIGTYTKARHQMLIDATYKLLGQKDAITGDVYLSNYYYDLVEFGGGVLADYAYYLLLGIGEARNASNTELYEARRDAFLQLILDVDAFKGTNLNFRLGKWTQEARDAAGEVVNPTTATADWYEYNNARTIVSTWSSPGTNLNDYSYRSWQGLLKDLYYPRWKHYFDNNCTSANYNYFAWNWAHGMVHEVGQTSISSTPLTSGQTGHTDTYTRAPEGNTVEKATEVLGKYIVPVKLADGSTYYAYRCLSNELNLTLATTEGATLDLSEYITFGNLDGVTMSITSSLIDGTATDLSAVTIKADACGGADSATDIVTVALSDGSTLTLTVVVNTTAMQTAKENLAALIERMESLAPQVATYNPVGVLTEVPLTTKQGSNGYIWTNAQSSQEGPIAGLIDGNTGTYLHTDYSGGDVTSGTHYIAVDLGADYKIGKFTFDYTTRHNGGYDFPDGIVVYGCDDNSNYTKIAEITEPAFPQSTNTKWELGKNLYSEMRYLRFNVLAERGYWHMSEFNIYQTASTAEVVDKYSEVIENTFAATQYDVLIDAKNTYDYGDTEQEITDAIAALEAAIAALEEKMALVETPDESPEHPELTALIGNFEELIGKIAEVVPAYSSEEITLTTTEDDNGYIWCNAPQNEAEGVGKLLDDDDNSFLHTTWGNNSMSNGDHYIAIDLGAGNELSKFKFFYKARTGTTATMNFSDIPNRFVVYGCNEKGGEYVKLADFTGLSQSSGHEWTSTEIISETPYRYLRFNGYTTGVGYWAMAKFELFKVVEIGNTAALKDADYTTLRGITSDEVASAYTALQGAIATNASGTADDKEAAYQNLKALYDALDAKLQYMPEGVYNINFGGNPVFVGYSTDTSGNNNTAGYKLIDPASGHITDVAQADALFTITHNGVGYSLSAQGKYLKNPHHDGWHHIMFSDDKAEDGRYMFEEVETGVYKLFSAVEHNNSANYVNDYGNVFGNDKKGTASSTFTLTQVTEYSLTMPEGGITTLCLPFNVTLPAGVAAFDIVSVAQDVNADRYEYTLELLASEGETIAKNTPVVVKGTAGEVYALAITMSDENVKTALTGSVLRGTFVKTTIGTDVANYTLVVTDGEATFNIVSAADTPVSANSCWMELPENRGDVIYDSEAQDPVIEPVEILDGAIYRIKGRLSDGTLRTLYTNGSNNRILWTTDEEKTDATTLFIAQKNEETGKYRLVSALANGIWSQDATLSEKGVELTLLNGSANGTVMILGDGKRRFCVDSDNLDYFSNVGDAPAGDYVNENVTTDFVLELVEDATVSYTVKMGKSYAYATLYLPFAVTVPDGVTAYVANTPTSSLIQLMDLQGIIPAYTPVVLYRESTTATEEYEFVYTTDAPNVDLTGVNNILTGYLIETLVEGATGYRYYMLMMYNTFEKFYWILKEYDSTGKLWTNVTTSNEKTHIKCSANKAFLAMSELQASSSYSFQLPGTTGIDEIVPDGGESDAIYDLHGRKIIEPVKGGIYIKSGKVFIAK